MKSLLAFLLILLIISCSPVMNSGTSTDVDIQMASVHGIVVTHAGFPIENAAVELFKSSINDSILTALDTVYSDDSGKYAFSDIDDGTYNISANFNDSLFATRRHFSHRSDTITDLATDTLLAPGILTGYVALDRDNNMGVLVYIPGTSYSARTDSSGFFIIHTIASGDDYSVAFEMYGYATTVLKNIIIEAGKTTTLDTISLIRNIYPSGLRSEYDTTNGVVKVSWNSLLMENLAGYCIYRKDSEREALFPEHINQEKLCVDTFFLDTIPEELFSRKNSIALQYQIKAKSLREDLSPFSNKLIVNVKTRRDSLTIKTLSFLEPLGAETVLGASECDIKWNYTGVLGDMQITFTPNGGHSWFSIVTQVDNQGFYTWEVPNISSDSCKIRVTSLTDTLLFDESDLFTIEAIDNSNLLKNGDFSQGLTGSWGVGEFEGATLNISNVDNQLICKTTLATADMLYPWYANLHHAHLPIVSGFHYRISFDAKCESGNSTIFPNLGQGVSPWTTYDYQEFTLTTEMTHYSADILMSFPDDMDAVFGIAMGMTEDIITLDNIRLERIKE